MKSFLPLMALLIVGASPAAVAAGNWMTDYEAAKAKAAAENKDLLMDFTGSDWCGWCIRLKDEVFDREAFSSKVGDDFILVELDFPEDTSKVPAETREQNKNLAIKYSVSSYPTIVLADSKGRPYAQTGYQPGGPEKYLEHLGFLKKRRDQRDATLAAAAKLEGVEKAKALLNAIGELPDATVDAFYGDLVADIKAADPGDESGFLKGRQYRRAVGEYEGQAQKLFMAKDFDGAITLADSFVETHDPSGEDKQHILLWKAMALVEKEQEAAALMLLDDIKAIAPESEFGAQIGMLKQRVNARFDQKNRAQSPGAQ